MRHERPFGRTSRAAAVVLAGALLLIGVSETSARERDTYYVEGPVPGGTVGIVGPGPIAGGPPIEGGIHVGGVGPGMGPGPEFGCVSHGTIDGHGYGVVQDSGCPPPPGSGLVTVYEGR